MFSRAAAILLALLALHLSALQAAAQPRAGGWREGGFRGGGFGGDAMRGGGFREGGFRGGGSRGGGGWGPGPGGGPRGFGGGYPGFSEPRGFRGQGRPGGYPGEGYGERPHEGAMGFRDERAGGAPYDGRGYVSPPVRNFPPPPARRAFGGGQGRAAFDGDWRAQQNEVRQAVREGRHIPLNQAIEAVRRRTPGRELDAGLEAGPDGRSIYRLRWAGQNGRRQDYLVDAGSGAIVGVQGGP